MATKKFKVINRNPELIVVEVDGYEFKEDPRFLIYYHPHARVWYLVDKLSGFSCCYCKTKKGIYDKYKEIIKIYEKHILTKTYKNQIQKFEELKNAN